VRPGEHTALNPTAVRHRSPTLQSGHKAARRAPRAAQRCRGGRDLRDPAPARTASAAQPRRGVRPRSAVA